MIKILISCFDESVGNMNCTTIQENFSIVFGAVVFPVFVLRNASTNAFLLDSFSFVEEILWAKS